MTMATAPTEKKPKRKSNQRQRNTVGTNVRELLRDHHAAFGLYYDLTDLVTDEVPIKGGRQRVGIILGGATLTNDMLADRLKFKGQFCYNKQILIDAGLFIQHDLQYGFQAALHQSSKFSGQFRQTIPDKFKWALAPHSRPKKNYGKRWQAANGCQSETVGETANGCQSESNGCQSENNACQSENNGCQSEKCQTAGKKRVKGQRKTPSTVNSTVDSVVDSTATATGDDVAGRSTRKRFRLPDMTAYPSPQKLIDALQRLWHKAFSCSMPTGNRQHQNSWAVAKEIGERVFVAAFNQWVCTGNPESFRTPAGEPWDYPLAHFISDEVAIYSDPVTPFVPLTANLDVIQFLVSAQKLMSDAAPELRRDLTKLTAQQITEIEFLLGEEKEYPPVLFLEAQFKSLLSAGQPIDEFIEMAVRIRKGQRPWGKPPRTEAESAAQHPCPENGQLGRLAAVLA